jgi:hypothetical protein
VFREEGPGPSRSKWEPGPAPSSSDNTSIRRLSQDHACRLRYPAGASPFRDDAYCVSNDYPASAGFLLAGRSSALTNSMFQAPPLSLRAPGWRLPKRAVAQGARLGRPKVDVALERKAQKQLKKGVGILKVAKMVGLGTGTVHRIKQEMGAV